MHQPQQLSTPVVPNVGFSTRRSALRSVFSTLCSGAPLTEQIDARIQALEREREQDERPLISTLPLSRRESIGACVAAACRNAALWSIGGLSPAFPSKIVLVSPTMAADQRVITCITMHNDALLGRLENCTSLRKSVQR